ncbi:Carboxysome shell and ethanolamine utilization microcompartment protein CcmL/EutN [Halanaerobium congolense]|jgi:microcompartment protein CcmL/EutN|uniref:Microcompartment protein CcmL/EutN n=1 Tax=Halanaerobium congolense TaxID=54121 RepID=A0A1M7PG93_9FIRM|nr:MULTISPECIES: BMC domain-containing protein [Halanaerobium]KXS49446.1 MAG: microcompartments protein [Halanaerobium sp. T82-1]OEG63747.1 MAG: propanediol utilization protein [Halanaerobium sp. MDAL1]PTX16119.1 microcompartment protein CcmL/EutN [Halanaerobium congolense]PUU95085.1 MAG: microcompartments protein [Halanaerobium sp.]TDX38441.1 microcompartment protein CcmL/EutN [Halanaerobium congolense]
MIIAIGLLEFNSISQGIKVADIMKKAADIEIIMAQPTCPGKYTVLISGSVSSVNASVESGVAGSGPFLVDHMVIPRIHHQLLSAMNGTTEIGDVNAVGVLEYFSVASAIFGADAAVKAAEINLMQVRLATGLGGKAYVTFSGDVGAVEQALEAGAAANENNGMLYNKIMISSPDKDLFKTLL